jgi:uncharacterized protein
LNRQGPKFLALGRHRSRWWRVTLTVLVASWVFGSLAVVLFERRLSFQPNPAHTPPASARLDGVVEQTLPTPDGERLVVWRLQARAGQPTLLYFHGNGEPLTYRSGRMASFAAEGWGVTMMAYRGFSGSTGTPSEATIVTDAVLAYDALAGEGVPARDIILYGESLGTHVALRVALQRPAAALVLEAPFTSMVDAWRQFVPLLPVGWLLRDRFDSAGRIARLDKPLLVLHGMRDRLVGFGLGKRLFAAAPEPKRFEVFPEAGHTNLYDYNAISAVRRFVTDVRTGAMR